MTATARHARHGAVTVAARQAITMAGPCEPGDVLGVVAGDFALVGEDLYDVATAVLDRLLGGGGELVTLVAGSLDEGPHAAAYAEVHPADLAARSAAWVEEHHPAVDVVVYDGGQQRYQLLMSVE
jgi:dihydroxyacetone kinase-like predicted kinase